MAVGVLAAAAVAAAADKSVHFVTMVQETEVLVVEEVAKADPQNPATFPHPFFGELNPLGWLRAAAYHEAHHLKALQASLPR